jgi:para-aminobenzoate synthetase component 1
MTLADLESLESFALLGPGYGCDGFLLLRGLADTRGPSASPRLVYAGFETPGSQARVLAPSDVARFDPDFGNVPLQDVCAAFDEDGIRESIQTIRQSIAAGDVYQVCLTHRVPLTADSGAPLSGTTLLSAICAGGVPPFAAWVRLPGGPEFVSASPERFFDTAASDVHAEPMKGTARLSDQAVLEGSAKDRCELAMITDLVRHDLAAVCMPRSIRVPCERRIVRLPYALQAVSDVEGTLRDGVGPLEVLDALNPGGSVVGAPKEAARAMIRRLESTPRGPYCGALGLWQGARSAFGLLIRTATRTPTGWTYGVGSGIVYDSDAAREIEEFRTKLGALGCARRPCR